jgi:mevalonate kinase
VIAHTGVGAPTSEINSRVRLWLEEAPEARFKSFQAIGDVTSAGLIALEQGDWAALGRWMTLNQLLLEKIGVGCPEASRLIDLALAAGAHGAKISGSGGGGIVIALVPEARQAHVAEALRSVAALVFTPAIGVRGVSVTNAD